ncbi:MAG: ribbon-helix-helix domain-containing protein [Deltaproteobacteria bacterium]|nr:ribbon-helix-helix domain-containing protein [Deltaproteobacteria bacterium]
MKRIQFNLDESLYKYLVALSRKTGITVPDLMRTAVDKVYGKRKKR